MPNVRCPRCRTVYEPRSLGAFCPVCGAATPDFRAAPESVRDVLPIDPRGVPWRRRWFGHVSPSSPQGVIAVVLIGVVAALLFALPLAQFVSALVVGFDDTQAPPTIDLGFLLFMFLVNTTFFVVLPLIYLALVYPGSPRTILEELRLTVGRLTVVWAIVGAVATFLAMLAMALVLALLVQLGVMEQPETSDLVLALADELNLALVIALPLVAAVTEEVFFRGFLQPRLGLVTSSLLFGVVHIGYGTWIQVVAPLVMGFVFGVLYLMTRSLWAPLAGHFTFNFVQLMVLWIEGG